MAAPLFDITEGWTEPLVAQLLIADAVFDATGMTAASVITDRNGLPVTVPTSWDVAASSQIKLSPVGTELLARNSPYNVHFKVTDGSGQVTYFPPGTPSTIAVHVP